MTALRAVAIVLLFASLAVADTVTCPGPNGTTVQKPVVNAAPPPQCGNPARPLDDYSLALLSGWKSMLDAQICICYHPVDLAQCQATRNYLTDVKTPANNPSGNATNGRAACLAYGTGLYSTEMGMFTAAIQKIK